MDIQTQKSYLFLHGRFLSACGSGLCSASNHSLTHEQRTGAGHSMMTSIRTSMVDVCFRKACAMPTFEDLSGLSVTALAIFARAHRAMRHSPLAAFSEPAQT